MTTIPQEPPDHDHLGEWLGPSFGDQFMTCGSIWAVLVRIARLEDQRAILDARADTAPKMRDRIRLRFAEATLAQEVQFWRNVAVTTLAVAPPCMTTGPWCAKTVIHRSSATTATAGRGHE